MPIDLERVKGLCFDIDGTISDTDDAWVDWITMLLSPINRVVKRWDSRKFARWLVMIAESPLNSLYYIMDALSLDDNYGRLFDQIARKRGESGSHFMLMPGTRELLDAVISLYRLCVVSARDQYTTGVFLQQFGLRDYFVDVVTNLTCKHTKPYPQPVLYAAQQMQISPQECLIIGDTPVDILSGKRAGAQTVGLLCGFGTERELRRAGADLILNDLHELRDLLFRR